MDNDCQYGKNGCSSLQNIITKQAINTTKISTHKESISQLWLAIDSIRSLLIKSSIILGASIAFLQIVLKFIPLGVSS